MPSLSHLPPSTWEDVYEPAEDTWLLCDALLRASPGLLLSRPQLVLEVGPGSGSVCSYLSGLLRGCAGGGAPLVFAVDLNPRACAVTRETARAHGVGARLEVVRCDLGLPLLQRLAGAVDVLLFNPPYVPTPAEEVPRHWAPRATGASGVGGEAGSTPAGEVGSPPAAAHTHVEADDADPSRRRTLAAGAWAGGDRGRQVIDRLLPLVARLLSPQGVMFMVALEENAPQELARRLRRDGLTTARVASVRAKNELLCVLRVRREGGGSP